MDGPSIARVDAPTEGRDPRTLEIDTMSTLSILEALNDEDATVAMAVRAALPALAQAVDVAVERYEAGGTIHYFGAGTSGRLALLDAAELPPTFSTDPARVVAHQAGGETAARMAVEGAEDDEGLGWAAAATVREGDVAVGIAASGRTPWVLGALRAAREAGAFTVSVTASPDGPLGGAADVHVCVETGPEAIAGSTRLKAGTAQKLVLNGFSTALMVRLGKTYSNLMVDVAPNNAKLRGRILSILEEVTGADEVACARTLSASGGDTKTALVSLVTGADPLTARVALERSGRRVRAAIDALRDAHEHGDGSWQGQGGDGMK
jgi:N-acetylmuramic acid 6-phosphate etherase